MAGCKGHAVSRIVVLMLTATQCLSAAQQRALTVEDSVRTRRIRELSDKRRAEVEISPDGAHVAYVVKAPDVVSNRNNYQLYVRDLQRTGRRENGRLVLQAELISDIKWLGSDNVVARVVRKSGMGIEESEVDVIRINDGELKKLELLGRVEEYSISADSNTVVFSVKATEGAAQSERQKTVDARGYPIKFGGSSAWPFPMYDIYVSRKGKQGRLETTKLLFIGPGKVQNRSSLRLVQRLNLLPDGKYLLLNYFEDDVPSGWEGQPIVNQLRRLGPAASSVLGLCEIGTGQLRMAFNYIGDVITTRWADDSLAYAVVSASPFGSAEGKRESEEAVAFGSVFFYLYRFNHLFVVNVRSGAVTKVLNRDSGQPGNSKFWVDLPLVWGQSDGEMIARLDDNAFVRMRLRDGEWKEVKRFETPRDGQYRSAFANNGKILTGISQSLMVPPDLFAYDIETKQTTLLTDLNPEYRNLQLGDINRIEWVNRYGSKCSGKLIKPVGYEAGKRYPLVLMASDFDNDYFISDSLYTTAFAPQSLANAGFVVLMAKYTRENKVPKGAFPGDMNDAYNWMGMMESAIDLLADRGIVDKDNVAITGFSRTSWLTDFTLTHSAYDFIAASSADSGLYNYGGYFASPSFPAGRATFESQLGGPPYGKTLKYSLEYSPAFNAEKVRAAVLMEYTGTAAGGFEFFVALSRLGKPAELYRYPNGAHPLDTPFERVASLQRNVDWFRFWMQGYEGKPPDYDPEQYVRWRELRKLRQQNEKPSPAPSPN